MKIMHVVGARPNFMKLAPVFGALAERNGFSQTLVHTGQHYDNRMSEVFFHQLGIPAPDNNLAVGSGSHATQTAQIMTRLEEVLLSNAPDLVLVYGDVNSTVAATLVCSKLLIPVGHVEAGLRSGDRTMPEEVNRVLTDQMAELLFTPSTDANENLLHEGISEERIHLVGNVMIDTLVRLMKFNENSHNLKRLQKQSNLPLNVLHNKYALVTLHRPSNVDDPEKLREIVSTLEELSDDLPMVFPVHPRTRKRILDCCVASSGKRHFYMLEPLGYVEFLILQKNALLVVTDSGGIQEETSFLGVPCLTLRDNTERPVTVTMGTNKLVGRNMDQLVREIRRILVGDVKKGCIPPLWDGRASERIADILVDRLCCNLGEY